MCLCCLDFRYYTCIQARSYSLLNIHRYWCCFHHRIGEKIFFHHHKFQGKFLKLRKMCILVCIVGIRNSFCNSNNHQNIKDIFSQIHQNRYQQYIEMLVFPGQLLWDLQFHSWVCKGCKLRHTHHCTGRKIPSIDCLAFVCTYYINLPQSKRLCKYKHFRSYRNQEYSRMFDHLEHCREWLHNLWMELDYKRFHWRRFPKDNNIQRYCKAYHQHKRHNWHRSRRNFLGRSIVPMCCSRLDRSCIHCMACKKIRWNKYRLDKRC